MTALVLGTGSSLVEVKDLCTLCRGACCEDTFIHLGKLDGVSLEFLRVRVSGVVRLDDGTWGFYLGKSCSHLKDGRCEVYEDRPQRCRDFTEGSRECFAQMQCKRPDVFRKQFLTEE